MEPGQDALSSSDEHVDGIEQPFYFESDHAALKGNPDYQVLLRTIAVLEAQRSKALRDLDKLIDLKDRALHSPLTFVEKLQNRVDLGIPQPQAIAKLPTVDWEKYATSLGDNPLRKHATRGKQLDVTPLLRKKHGGGSAAAAAIAMATAAEGATVVRGRVKDESKPQTFNQLWTSAEQRRLEELLVEFPPEEVEARRFQKIADALGNRTYHQVASRIQKYFIKLAKAGLPVPGRIPNLASYHSKNKGPRRHQRYNYWHSAATSTMMQSYVPPVYMREQDDEDDGFGGSLGGGAAQFAFVPSAAAAAALTSPVPAALSSLAAADCKSGLPFGACLPPNGSPMMENLDDIPEELQSTDEYRELVCLLDLRKQKLRRGGLMAASTWQDETCDVCYCCSRALASHNAWRCVNCTEDDGGPVYVCDNCLSEQASAGCHDGSHTVVPFESDQDDSLHRSESSGSFVDRDYIASNFNIPGCNNYLDPNYMPAA